mgnify:CR=1 FL=1
MGGEEHAAYLSGGNLQKFVIGREVLQDPDVLVVNQPTWGVDAAAAAAIRQSILDLAAKGAAILIISQDLDELIEISDRFCALYEGRLSQIKKFIKANKKISNLNNSYGNWNLMLDIEKGEIKEIFDSGKHKSQITYRCLTY